MVVATARGYAAEYWFLTMQRMLRWNDFPALHKLAKPYLEQERLPYDHAKAYQAFTRMCTDHTCYLLGEFDGDKLEGAIGMKSGPNLWTTKQNATLVFWLGALNLLDEGIKWAFKRPAVRCVVIGFDRDVRPGVYKFLQRRGFERSGDFHVKWV